MKHSRCSFNAHPSCLLPAVSSPPETRLRPTTLKRRRRGPKLHPAFPDWVAAACRTPDLSPRVATFNLCAIDRPVMPAEGVAPALTLDCDLQGTCGDVNRQSKGKAYQVKSLIRGEKTDALTLQGSSRYVNVSVHCLAK